ncbi:DMT family transporter [Hydrogenophaga sp. BPS33]|uniref:DMT family transporter n=1 Tax=Hydrogenophaga sp. BPS33 TaxID=2651974 RepID=UPI00131FFC36|nr:DMT family transporter [Hydrogenophaga sp. BPS33]QHE84979.1 DMT family transporter [Hydrogenophaga sp. BPS33]
MPSTDHARLSPATLALLIIPPLLWAGNAVVGRMMQGVIPPVTLNFVRWALAFLLLLPMAGWVLRPGPHGMWPHWRRFALLGLLGVGTYNALQYLALKTSSPMNVTLVASSGPVWVLMIGRIFYGVAISRRAALGAALSLAGVAVVLSHGRVENLLAVRFALGDGLMLLASMLWSFYSWQLARPEPTHIQSDWSAFLLAQVVMGVGWSGLYAAGEWMLLPPLADGASHIRWGWPLAAGLLYVALGPSLLAYRCWGAAIGRAGPTIAALFNNLTPLFAALMSATLLNEPPHLFHAVSFVLIVCGILISSSPRR